MTDGAGAPRGGAPLAGARLLFLELGDSHDEVLLSWWRDVRALGADVWVACPRATWERLALPGVRGYHPAAVEGSLAARLAFMRRLRRWILAERITHVVLNTATGTMLRDLVLFLPSRCRVVGTLHDVGKLGRLNNQTVITARVAGYAVLAPYLLDAVPEGFRTPVVVAPATAPDPDAAASATTVGASSEAPLRVIVPGGIDFRRRDYASILAPDALARLGGAVRLVLAGRPVPRDRALLERALAAADGTAIEVHDRFLPHDAFARLVAGADAVLALAHPSCAEWELTRRVRISGAMSNAWAYARPLLLERTLAAHPSFGDAICYDVPDLPATLARLAADRAALRPHAVTPAFAAEPARRAAITRLLLDAAARADRASA